MRDKLVLTADCGCGYPNLRRTYRAERVRFSEHSYVNVMSELHTTRLVVIGNSGSGKSTFAKRIGAALNLPTHDLDVLHWHLDGRKREEGEAKALVAEVAAGTGWVIEGVWGWLVEIALARATVLVWLDLSWDECREGLLQRGPHHGMNPSDPDALLAWTNPHWDRLAGHAQLYSVFGGHKVRLRTRREVAAFSDKGISEGSGCKTG
jgi:energy-coupling factor transporter ATP-binding protein EcfA2